MTYICMYMIVHSIGIGQIKRRPVRRADTVDGEYGSALHTENANVEDLRLVKVQMGGHFTILNIEMGILDHTYVCSMY